MPTEVLLSDFIVLWILLGFLVLMFGIPDLIEWIWGRRSR